MSGAAYDPASVLSRLRKQREAALNSGGKEERPYGVPTISSFGRSGRPGPSPISPPSTRAGVGDHLSSTKINPPPLHLEEGLGDSGRAYGKYTVPSPFSGARKGTGSKLRPLIGNQNFIERNARLGSRGVRAQPGGFKGMGTECRPSGGAVLCFMVVFVVTIISVVVTNYAILTGEKNIYRVAKPSNNTIMFAHISQTPAPNARVGIHNSNPQAIFEVTTHANVKNHMRLSRMLASGGTDNAGPTALEFGTYRVSGDGTMLWYAGPQLQASSDGRLSIDSGGGSGGTQTSPVHINSQSSGNILVGNGGGSLGIGTLYPSAKLDVEGDAHMAGTVTLDRALKLGKMTMAQGSPTKGEIRYVDDDFVGYTDDRGWQSLTATVHSAANGTNGFLSYFVGPTGTSGLRGLVGAK